MFGVLLPEIAMKTCIDCDPIFFLFNFSPCFLSKVFMITNFEKLLLFLEKSDFFIPEYDVKQLDSKHIFEFYWYKT